MDFYLVVAGLVVLTHYPFCALCLLAGCWLPVATYIGWRDGSHSDASHNPHKGG